MTGNERRAQIYSMLSENHTPLAARVLAEKFSVSRQIVVSDIALLRAEGHEIVSTSRGYLLTEAQKSVKVFKVRHTDEDAEKELNLIVDFGGVVEDVFVYHKLYGVVRAEMNIRSRKDVKDFMEGIRTGASTYLKNVTSGYHYHTVSAPTDTVLKLIHEQLNAQGFLAQLQDYEPVDFWSNAVPEE